ncbi:MAG: 4Fe-4S dicluster domain-containing protein [Candidatus Omnitrophica bacterium]|nr:4Fe-4S dicluster domain-containing protein [Candidatus Omnitrophota bacterium]
MERYFITYSEWVNFLGKKSQQSELMAPVLSGSFLHYQKCQGEELKQVVWSQVRPVQPVKFFFFPYHEEILPGLSEQSPRVILGVTACDLAGLQVLDRIFAQSDFKDPNYQKRRERTLIISGDCYAPIDVCFCEKVGLQPYPEKGFDLNVSALEGGFLLEVGSEKGRNFLSELTGLSEASEEQLHQQAKMRNKAKETVLQFNQPFNFPSDLPNKIQPLLLAEEWKEVWQKCVQCGSCNFICPSCACFFLEDQSRGESFEKARTWDACLFPGYARMASGVSPRPHLYERYRNRLACKYVYLPGNFGLVGCTGCGRCIDGCAGRIDKRKVLTKIFGKNPNSVIYEPAKHL